MRLFRSLMLALLLGIVGWLVVRSVSLESTDEMVQIRIDKRKLKEAGEDLQQQGRQAADKLGQALVRTGRKLDRGSQRPETH